METITLMKSYRMNRLHVLFQMMFVPKFLQTFAACKLRLYATFKFQMFFHISQSCVTLSAIVFAIDSLANFIIARMVVVRPGVRSIPHEGICKTNKVLPILINDHHNIECTNTRFKPLLNHYNTVQK